MSNYYLLGSDGLKEIGYCEDGCIYAYEPEENIIGRYEYNHIYVNDKLVGYYDDNGYVFSGQKIETNRPIGKMASGVAFRGNLPFDAWIVGGYDQNMAGGAALLLLFSDQLPARKASDELVDRGIASKKILRSKMRTPAEAETSTNVDDRQVQRVDGENFNVRLLWNVLATSHGNVSICRIFTRIAPNYAWQPYIYSIRQYENKWWGAVVAGSEKPVLSAQIKNWICVISPKADNPLYPAAYFENDRLYAVSNNRRYELGCVRSELEALAIAAITQLDREPVPSRKLTAGSVFRYEGLVFSTVVNSEWKLLKTVCSCGVKKAGTLLHDRYFKPETSSKRVDDHTEDPEYAYLVNDRERSWIRIRCGKTRYEDPPIAWIDENGDVFTLVKGSLWMDAKYVVSIPQTDLTLAMPILYIKGLLNGDENWFCKEVFKGFDRQKWMEFDYSLDTYLERKHVYLNRLKVSHPVTAKPVSDVPRWIQVNGTGRKLMAEWGGNADT